MSKSVKESILQLGDTVVGSGNGRQRGEVGQAVGSVGCGPGGVGSTWSVGRPNLERASAEYR